MTLIWIDLQNLAKPVSVAMFIKQATCTKQAPVLSKQMQVLA